MQINHLAILVHNLDAVAKMLPDSCRRHEVEQHATEGTIEQYITFGDETTPSLLLIQAVANGPYKRALQKRGPGVHHIGCVCRDIEEEVTTGMAASLLLHPISLITRKQGTVWLCKPGLPYLVELTEDAGQDAIHFDSIWIQLGSTKNLPEYGQALARNLIMRTGAKEKLIRIRIGETDITIDPYTR